MGKRRRYSSSRRPSKRRRGSAASYLKAYKGGTTYPATTKSAVYGPSNSQIAAAIAAGQVLERTEKQGLNRIRDNFYGPGSYVGKYGSRAIGAIAGAGSGFLAGGPDAAAKSAYHGWRRGANFSRAMGWGEYSVDRAGNDTVASSGGDAHTPVYHTSTSLDESGDIIISNRELVSTITSSSTVGAFKTQQWTLNPADPTFQHLRQIAQNYECFEFEGLMFQYVPLYGEGGATNSLGVIGSVTNYDPNTDRPPVDMDDLTRYKGSVTTKPSLGMIAGVECDPAKRSVKRMFIRDHVERDATFTDLGTFHFASSGVPESDATLGQLWVTYSCKLSVHKLRDLDSKEGVVFRDAIRAYFPANATFAGPNKLLIDEGNSTIRSPYLKDIVTSSTDFGTNRHMLEVSLQNVQKGDRFMVIMQATFSANSNSLRDVSQYPIYQRTGTLKLTPRGHWGSIDAVNEGAFGVVDNAEANPSCHCGISLLGIEITDTSAPMFVMGVLFKSGSETAVANEQTVNIQLRITKMHEDDGIADEW